MLCEDPFCNLVCLCEKRVELHRCYTKFPFFLSLSGSSVFTLYFFAHVTPAFQVLSVQIFIHFIHSFILKLKTKPRSSGFHPVRVYVFYP